MYFLPGYVHHYEENGMLYVLSDLLQNEVKITVKELQEEFHSIVDLGGCTDISTPLTQFLHEQELLLNEEECRQAVKEAIELLDDTLLLTIMPTEGCNFRCSYCYEDHRMVSMNRDTLDRIREYIAEHAPRFEQVCINWFGGEPTLCKDTVLEIAGIVNDLSKKYSFIYHSGMTTNGYLLDAQTVLQFYNVGITAFQITLDGWNHDQTRPHVSGKGTLKTILDNLVEISSTLPEDQYSFQITLRQNILAEDRDFSWYDYLHKHFGSDSRFSVLVRSVDDWGGNSVQSLNLLKGVQRSRLLSEHIAYLDKIGMRRDNGREGLFSKICYASYPYGFVFRANGKIEKCTVALDHPKNLVGYVDQDKGIILNNEANQLWSTCGLKQECYTCSDILSCFNMRCKKHSIIDGQETPCSCELAKIY